MGLFAKLFKLDTKPQPPRRRLDGPTVCALLREALKSHLAANYRHVSQKTVLAVTTKEKIVQAADRCFQPWRENVWECEDQSRAVVNEAQRMAANEGCSWAVGTLRGAASATMLHVWVWALIEDKQARLFPQSKLVVYDPTAREWEDIAELKDVDYTFT